MTDHDLRELLAACLLRLQQLEPYAELTRRVGEALNEGRACLRTGGVVPPSDARAEIETANVMRREVVDALAVGSGWIPGEPPMLFSRPVVSGVVNQPEITLSPIRVVAGKGAA